MKARNISQYMLEMYNMNLASPKERKLVESALAEDAELRLRYEALVESDREIHQRYPVENMPFPAVFRETRVPAREYGISRQGAHIHRRLKTRKRFLIGLSAAAALFCVFFFSLIYIRNLGRRPVEIASVPNNEIGWARGTENDIREFSISIYPIETKAALSQEERENGLPDGTILKEGDSLQLVYTTPPGGEYEGVIFSISGRPGVDAIPIFPMNTRDRPKLTSGREALGIKYILDSAPDYEIFFLVASQNPMDAEMIIKSANAALAGELSAGEHGRNLDTVLEKIYNAFEGYEVKHSYINIIK